MNKIENKVESVLDELFKSHPVREKKVALLVKALRDSAYTTHDGRTWEKHFWGRASISVTLNEDHFFVCYREVPIKEGWWMRGFTYTKRNIENVRRIVG